ncbi:MAG: Holliday junction resolvase RuvX [Polyangiales bacterium]
MSRIVGIDPGEARIGIAISDDDGSIAFPRETVLARGGALEAARRVRTALGDDEISLVVVGLPLRLDGSEGEAARRAKAFGAVLGQVLEVEIAYWDERLTTVAAERSLREMGRRGAKQRAVVDQSAATILLQGYLDAKKGGRWQDPNSR